MQRQFNRRLHLPFGKTENIIPQPFFMKKTSYTLLLLSLLLLAACAGEQSTVNQLSEKEKAEGWQLLFDGKSMKGWHLYNKGQTPSAWRVQNGELYCQREMFDVEHGDLVSDREYENFDFMFEWRIEAQGNSGVFFNVLERSDIPAAWASGPEYQLLEKTHADYAANPKKRPGCLYNFATVKNEVEPKPTGEWNQGRIKQRDGKVEFYLNGVLTAEQDLTTPEWQEQVANSNFKNFPEFGKHRKGRLGLQDWAKGVAFRNLKVLETK